MKVRARNEEDRMRKDNIRMQKDMEEQRRLAENMAHKEANKNAIANNNHNRTMKQMTEAQRLKHESNKNNEIINLQKQ